MRNRLVLTFLATSAIGSDVTASPIEQRQVIAPAQGGAKPVPDDVMKRVYEEAKTPFKYGVGLKGRGIGKWIAPASSITSTTPWATKAG